MNQSLGRILIGAAFLMATSAIGPGFLTQTTVFTEQLGASFAFAIGISILLDLVVQWNIWRIVTLKEKHAQDILNAYLPGLGKLVSALIVFGGLAFNVGNLAGAGLGLEAFADMDPVAGSAVSALLAVLLFRLRDGGRTLDRFSIIMGFIMILLTLYTIVYSRPPIAEVMVKAVAPAQTDWQVIITIVGGTVGGYISFAGAHRLLEAGVSGKVRQRDVRRSASMAIGVASLMRVLLFLAVLGIVSQGYLLDPENPPASVFRLALGEVGYRLFGLIMWVAAITSVVGSSFTTVSFLLRNELENWKGLSRASLITLFVGISLIIFITIGRPVGLLLAAGYVNGLILPIALLGLLLADRRSSHKSFDRLIYYLGYGIVVTLLLFFLLSLF